MNCDASKLRLCPWEQLQTNHGNAEWLFKFIFEDNCFLIALTNISTVYAEVLTEKEIESRCKEINKRLEAPVENILKHLQQSLMHHRDFSFFCSKNSHQVIELSFSNHFRSGIPFNWRFDCKQDVILPGRDGSLSKYLLYDPMIISISRLQYENAKLKDIVKQKDNEISDYRDSGYKVSRPHLQTEMFDSASFEKDLKVTMEYGIVITKEPIKIAAGRSFNDLLITSSEESKSDEMIKLTQSPPLKTSNSLCSTDITSHNILNKKRMKRKRPRPAVRGCVLEPSDDDSINTISSSKSVSDGASIQEEVKIASPKIKTKRKPRGKLF